ncbi:hypothetical protein SAMN05444166_4891 [Singulisphaera sp. GP187]|uniref:hypothetical protein n=1 Tax=Singulisphaera sp. GP187 TaxID=1882752 RepID=UPI000925EAA6|nr:hypothetical protein [Singulisphaera sp. GP187]SIO45737.1 hypothetical protein SAMN05444166_4891 [Singulisphaera sp. GP187]
MWHLALCALRRFCPTRPELAGLVACALTFAAWNAAATQTLTPAVPLFFLVLGWVSVLVGRSAVRIAGVDGRDDFPTAFLFGFLLLNSALLVLAWISVFSIITNAVILLACALALQAVGPPRPAERGLRLAMPGLLAVILSLAAATLWSQDSITAQSIFPDGVVLRPWVDSLFHARQVQVFRDSPGPVVMDDPRMAGQPMWFYHHGSYMTTALLARMTGTPTFLAYTSFQVPFGVVLSGLAAYALICSLWGDRAGVAAAAVLLLLPDASWHGFANPCLGYAWLQQIAPAGQYAVAILAVAWILMFEGCRTGRLSLVALAFLATGLALHYKAHLFVAAALVIWVYPALFLTRFRWRWNLRSAHLWFIISEFPAACNFSDRRPSPCQAGSESGVATWRARS